TESPSHTSTRAPSMSATTPGSGGIPSKYGGCRTYVDPGSHANSSPSGTGSERQVSSPVNTSAYVSANCSARTEDAIVSLTSPAFGQMSWRKTSSPSGVVPSGSLSKSMSIRPASEYATTSGGDAR